MQKGGEIMEMDELQNLGVRWSLDGVRWWRSSSRGEVGMKAR